MLELQPEYLNACIINQRCRDLLNENTDPLFDKAQKHQQSSRDRFSSSLTGGNVEDFFHTEKATSRECEDNDLLFDFQESSSFSALSKKEKGKKDKKKAKKRKKKSEKMFASLNHNLFEKTPRNANLLSETYKLKRHVIIYNHVLYVYDEVYGCYQPKNFSEVASDIKNYLDEDLQLRISNREYQEAYEQLMISKDIVCENGFFENGPYVNCLNGVVDVNAGELKAHCPDFRFKHCVRAEYDPYAKCSRFLKYVEYITGGDKELKKLLRVIMGYIFSHYNNAKRAILIYGIPHTGKSVLCNLISRIIGEDYVTHIDIAMLYRQEYAAAIANSMLNVVPDLKNEPLKDVGFFKSLVSKDDVITARALYANPSKIKCETKMLFSSNHLISFASDVDLFDMEAVFNRLLYFPFQNAPIRDSENNKHLSEELFEERNGIFTWAMGGLGYYVDHNENFPPCALSDEMKDRNIAKFCPEKMFFTEAIERAEGRFESSTAIKAAFEKFCVDIGVEVKGNIQTYLEEHEQISKVKKRVTSDGYISNVGNPIYVYKDIRLKEKYRNEGRWV